LKERLGRLDWAGIERALFEQGFSRVSDVLTPDECGELVALYGDDRRFRKRIDMQRHTFGRGDYGYFAQPLPRLVGALRTNLYRRLAPIANSWAELLGRNVTYPGTLREFAQQCARAGQGQPTPLMLHYETGGYNRLHQDFYGDIAFPLQAAVLLSAPGRDFVGGEFLLVEQKPRSQSRGWSVALEQGELILFPCGERPSQGARGNVRLNMRHGVSTLHSGQRYTLGIIFHDSRT
jgi:hypothetical protein